MPWFVVLTEPLNNDGKITAYVKYYPSVKEAEQSLNEQNLTPYATQAEAKAAALKYNKQPASQKTATHKANIPEGSTKGVGFTNPITGIDQVGAVLKAAFTAITDVNMWRSIGWLFLGLSLLTSGLLLWAKGEDAIPNVVPVPV